MFLGGRFSAWLLLFELLTACSIAGKGGVVPSSSATMTAELSAATLAKTTIPSCPVTLPNGKVPPDQRVGDFYYGNKDGTLFTDPWPEGIVIFAPGGPGHVLTDGSLEMKWSWWRGARGALTIGGRRLDAPAPPLQADITKGYGNSGFLPVDLIFPTQGCWEVTGRVGNKVQLTFVTLVLKVPFRFISLNWGPEGLVSTKRDASHLPESLRDIESFSSGGELITASAVDERAMITPDASATQQKVTVQGHPGICVQGTLVNQQWQDNIDAGFLEWAADGASYRISQRGLGLHCSDLLSMVNTP